MTDTASQDREHSSIVGGSNASRMLNCPGHYQIIQRMQAQLDGAADEIALKAGQTYERGSAALEAAIENANALRDSLNKSSIYADEGTALHKVMEYLVDNDVDPNTIIGDAEVDRIFDEYELHDDRMHDAVIPAYRMFNEFLDRIMEEDECDEVRIRVENKVEMPGIDDAFGTVDILIRTPKRTVVWDWKFGAGVPVAASYKLPDRAIDMGVGNEPEIEPGDEYGNDQLMFYARAAMETHPDYFDGTKGEATSDVHLVICQPRILDEISEFRTGRQDLENFRLDLVDAVREALDGDNPELKIGKWCNFAPCKAQCPLHLNGPVAMAQVAEKLGKLRMRTAAGVTPASVDPVVVAEHKAAAALEYAEALAMMLDLAEIVEPYLREAQKQAHEFMEAGGIVPGYKLVPKRAGHDAWNDPEAVDSFLGRRGFDTNTRRKPMEPVTPAVARKLLKSKGDDKGLKLLEKYVKPGVSSGTNVAPADDARPAVEATATQIAGMAEKLKRIGVA